MNATIADAPPVHRPVYKERVLASSHEQAGIETQQARMGKVFLTKLRVIANFLSQSSNRELSIAEAAEIALGSALEHEYAKALDGLAKLKKPSDPPAKAKK